MLTGLAFASAVESIQAGSDVTLALGAEVQTTTSARQGGEFLARASHFQRQSMIDDFVFPAMFARRIKACLAAGLLTAEDLALLSVKAYKNANLNPLAHMHHATMTYETALTASKKNPNFLGNPDLKDYLKVSDCSQVSDGGAGVILCSEDGLRKLGKHMSDCVEVIGVGQTAGNLYTDCDPTTMATTAAAAQIALKQADVGHAEIDVAEVHDCFNISELLQLEAMGFAERGCAVKLLRDGHLDIDGKLPVNTVPSIFSSSHCG